MSAMLAVSDGLCPVWWTHTSASETLPMAARSSGQAADAARGLIRSQKVRHVVAVPPFGRGGDVGRMPHVIEPRVANDGHDSHAGGAKTLGEVIVFAAPTDEAFIETVHALEVAPPDAEVAASELGLRVVTDRLIKVVLDPSLPE